MNGYIVLRLGTAALIGAAIGLNRNLHHKPSGLLNVANYFGPLMKFFDHSVDEGFVKPAHAELVEARAPFPPEGAATDRPKGVTVFEPGFA